MICFLYFSSSKPKSCRPSLRGPQMLREVTEPLRLRKCVLVIEKAALFGAYARACRSAERCGSGSKYCKADGKASLPQTPRSPKTRSPSAEGDGLPTPRHSGRSTGAPARSYSAMTASFGMIPYRNRIQAADCPRQDILFGKLAKSHPTKQHRFWRTRSSESQGYIIQ